MKSRKTPIWLNHFWLIAGAVNVRIKILGIIIGLVLLLGLTVTWQVRRLLTQTMYTQLEEQSIAISRNLAARVTDPILINDVYSVHQLLQDTRTNYESVRYAFIVSSDGYIIAHTFGDGFPKGLLDANIVNPDEYHHTRILGTNEGQIRDTAVPIFEGRVGIARIGVSDRAVQQTIDAVTGQLLLTTVMISVVGLSAAVFLTWILTNPILDLVEATQAIALGNFSYRVQRWASDEIGELADAFNNMAAALAKAALERSEREQMRVQYVRAVITAQEDERKRIARELHDSTSQSLTSLMIGLKTLADTCHSSEMQKRAEELRELVGQTLDDVHLLSLQLRPSVLDDLGLPEALHRHVADCQKRHEMAIDVAITGLDEQRLPAEIETALYRIVQEALTNIMRHAQADTSSIFIECNQDKVLAIIEDNGKGFDISQVAWHEDHLGLYGMRERVELLFGSFTIETKLGQGTSLYIEIPLQATE